MLRLNRRKNRAIALLTAIFFGVLCFGLATGFLLQVPMDLTATSELRRSTEASYVADAAIQDTMAWISHTLANSDEPCTNAEPTPLKEGAIDAWEWTCLVEPDSGTPPNSFTDLRLYRLTAVALLDGKEQYRTVVDVQAGQSFARFSVYMDEAQVGSGIWYDFVVTPESRMRGPIHKNAPISFKLTESLLLAAPEGEERPINSVVSTTSDRNWWTFGSDWAGRFVPPSSSQYDNVLQNGEGDLQFSVAPRPLPGDSLSLSNAAWGGLTPAEAEVPGGVSVNPAGGVFISGDVDHMQMSVNGSGHFVLGIEQGSQVTTVVEDSSSGQRVVTDPDGNVSTVTGLGSGVIFATGDILSLEGINKGAHTIANRFDSGKYIEITGSLTRTDTPVGTEPSGTSDRLGIVTDMIYIADHSRLPRDPWNTLYLYAHMLATNSLKVRDYNGNDPGAMEIYGGLATGYPWRTVKVEGEDYRVVGGYGAPPKPPQMSGFGSAPIHYDKYLDSEPPPMYPTTAGTELMIRSWREQRL